MNAASVRMGIDRPLALSRVGGDIELLREIAGLFLDDYPRVLAELRVAVGQGDARGVEHAAHGLKGSVANFGAQAAVDAALALETLGRSGRLDGWEPMLQTLELALQTLRPELEALQ